MPDIIEPILFDVDLARRKVVRRLRGGLSVGDRSAAKVILKCTQDGQAVDLTGVTAYGRFFRPGDGAEIRLNDDTINKDTVTVALIDECFVVAGYFELDVVVVLGGVHRTLVTLSGEVHTGGSGALVDIDGVVPSLDDIIAQYATMQRVTQDATAAKNAANTAASTANTAASNANSKATAAQNAANAANAAAAKWDSSDSALLASKDPAYYVTAHQLLDNGNFLDPINQRGKSSYTGGSGMATGYTIDRWYINRANAVLSIESGSGITINNTSNANDTCFINQRMPIPKAGIYTVIAKGSAGLVYQQYNCTGSAVTAVPGKAVSTAKAFAQLATSDGLLIVQIGTKGGQTETYEWAAVYAGAYTDQSAPPYVPKGYAAELLACQRYCLAVSPYGYYGADMITTNSVIIMLPTPIGMRVKPSIESGDMAIQSGDSGSIVAHDGFTFTVASHGWNFIRIDAAKTAHGLKTAALRTNSNIIFTADYGKESA